MPTISSSKGSTQLREEDLLVLTISVVEAAEGDARDLNVAIVFKEEIKVEISIESVEEAVVKKEVVAEEVDEVVHEKEDIIVTCTHPPIAPLH